MTMPPRKVNRWDVFTQGQMAALARVRIGWVGGGTTTHAVEWRVGDRGWRTFCGRESERVAHTIGEGERLPTCESCLRSMDARTRLVA